MIARVLAVELPRRDPRFVVKMLVRWNSVLLAALWLPCLLLAMPQGLLAKPQGEDWPTHRKDYRRSGSTEESLSVERLRQVWDLDTEQMPRPAWPGPARWDAWAGIKGLRSMRNYDPVFHPIAVGDFVYFGSSVDDSIECIRATDGSAVWRFTTQGPIRIAPTWWEGRLYFGSDDGFVYCVEAETGDLVWKFSPTEGRRQVIQDGRLISFWPVRTGVAVRDGVAYFAASMLPWKTSYLCAVDAETGKRSASQHFVQDLGPSWTLEGPLLLSESSVIVPQGRVEPLLFDRATGESRGMLEGGGGSFCLLTEDDHVLVGPGNKTGWITDSSAATREKVASYARGNAILVEGSTAYLLSDRYLAAMDRASKILLWNQRTQTPYCLIRGGDTLYCGGEGVITAHRREDGELIWARAVEGRVHGLLLARGRLIASTDRGRLYAFGEGPEEVVGVVPGVLPAEDESELALGPPPPLPPVNDPGLVDHWIFQSNTMANLQFAPDDPRTTPVFQNQRPDRLPAKLLGTLDLVQAGPQQAFALDGLANDLTLTNDLGAARLPKKDISVAAWVRLDQALEWGGILGAAQDNGEYERGWMLGYRQSRLGFALAGEQGNERIHWLLTPEACELGRWYHLVGTYDGKQQRLYLDGERVAQAETQRGRIRYPEQAVYHIGAYRDEDEYFRMTGALNELRVYARCLSAAEIRDQYRDKHADFPAPPPPAPVVEPFELASGPRLRHLGSGRAEITWETERAVPSRLGVRAADTLGQALASASERFFVDSKPTRRHRVVVDELAWKSVYLYRIFATDDEAGAVTRDFELDMHFVYPRPELSKAPKTLESYSSLTEALELAFDRAEMILKDAKLPTGIALVYGEDQIPFALALKTSQPQLELIVVDEAKKPRRNWASEFDGLYGSYFTVYEAEDLTRLPWPSSFANLIVFSPDEEFAPASSAVLNEALRLLRPYGGHAYLPADGPRPGRIAQRMVMGEIRNPIGCWRRYTRRGLRGAGAWTHMYGAADNSAFGGEELAGATSTDDLEVQWIGRPGPRYQTDRQNRKPAPLAVNGRLFAQGLNRVLALDAFNGSILWGLELPELQRFNMPRDCANWCADDSTLYLALGASLALVDGATGEIRDEWSLTAGPRQDFRYDWGYVAQLGDRVLGSAVKAGSSFTDWWGKDKWYDAIDGESTFKVCSDNLFARRKSDGGTIWEYQRGLILNATICATEDTVYFVEAGDASLSSSADRRIEDPRLWQDLKMVALDLETGRPRWEREAKPMPGRVAFYLAHGEGRLAMVSSANNEFALYVFDARDGSSLWRKKFSWEVDHHGKALSRPAIVGGELFLRPLSFDLQSGEVRRPAFPEGHQCGTYVATEHALFLRAGELAVWDRETGKSSRWSRLRPDCWISTIPACGMLLAPEGGGGCSCGSWMEVSIGFLPKGAR